MAWIRNNTFFAAFLAVMIIGVGALGYLLYSSYDNYSQVAEQYDSQVKELQRLQANKPFPSQANLAKYQQERNDYRAAVDSLQTKLAARKPATEAQLSPAQFQDNLRATVDEITKEAQQFNVAYPENFYLGFERYRSSLPDPGATTALAAQLENVKQLARILIGKRVEKITAITRSLLPQENGAVPAAAPAGGRPGANPAPATGDLVTRVPVVLAFSGPPASFRDVLNEITRAQNQLFVLRAVQVKNQVDKGPDRGQPQTPVGGNSANPAAPGPDAGGSEPLPEKGPPPLRYVLGQERVDVVARVELTQVAAKR